MQTVDLDGNKYLLNLNNSADVFDAVVDATYANVRLDQGVIDAIGYAMYRDRRGGNLDYLWGNEEFMDCLDWQMGIQ